MGRFVMTSLAVVTAVVTVACSAFAASFGEQRDIDEATTLWKMMEKAHLVGAHAVLSKPYRGVAPHGRFMDKLETRMTIDGHSGRLIITRNYGEKGVTRSMVANAQRKYLNTITVMYQREAGYDKANQNWFWSKYSADGEVLKNAQGVAVAGRVDGDNGTGCIACHRAAPGGDYVYSNDMGIGLSALP